MVNNALRQMRRVRLDKLIYTTLLALLLVPVAPHALTNRPIAIGDGANPAESGTPGGGSGGAIYNDGNTFTLTLQPAALVTATE